MDADIPKLNNVTPLSYKDFTLKARIRDSLQTENLLSGLKARYVGTDHQTDTYFKVEKGKLKWRKGNIENLITHYERISENGFEKTIVYRYDLNPSDKEIKTLFSSYATLAIIEKERKIFFLDNVKIHLDTTKDGKTFIEIEASDENDLRSLQELQHQCLTLKASLRIEDKDLMKTGYL
jgi:adenylate cyclase class 2